ncbi:MAG: phospholipase [Actinobacteria bacterium]|nr:phospholipase [Actinomycetota bacterium]
MGDAFTRREAIRAGAAAGAGLAALASPGLRAALAAPRRAGRLSDIDHVVIFIQENRSFDHYFGTLRGVRGFGDTSTKTPFAQQGYPVKGYGGRLLPFHLDSNRDGECTHDLTHEWGPQHRSWNRGRMDSFVREHMRAEGQVDGALTMAYYDRSDLAYYYALAEAFTLCDGYHCAVMGPTDPNQLYLVSGTLDPAGRNGGPILETYGSNRPQKFGSLSWTTMPEQLRALGVSWKVYTTPDNLSPEGDTPLPLFKQYQTDPGLGAAAFGNQFPQQFQADCAAGTLPQVSWIWGPVTQSEHPPAPTEWGEYTTDQILTALTGNSSLWARSALLVTWDENGGFFDHVPPPTPPAGTAGEYVTARPLPAAAEGIAGPIGLGFRVPLLIASPFSRGGFVCSDLFDHTSTLQFLERRFGAEVPHLSAWRRSVAGDLTSAFNFAAPDASVPKLPATSLSDQRVVGPGANCPTEPASLAGFEATPYTVPPSSRPRQEKGRARRPSGPRPAHERARGRRRR